MDQDPRAHGGLRAAPGAMRVAATVGKKMRVLAPAVAGENEAARRAGALDGFLAPFVGSRRLDELAQRRVVMDFNPVPGQHGRSGGAYPHRKRPLMV